MSMDPTTPATNTPAVSEPLDVMIDLETVGRRPFCPVIAIGACLFHMGEVPAAAGDNATPWVADVFYQAITLESCLDLGLRIHPETLLWWMGAEESSPSEAARKSAFFDPQAVTLPLALDAFTTWLISRPVRLWGNSARFDLGILESAYTACGKTETPWHFRNERCYRTIRNIPAAQDVPMVRFGTYHNALDDAITQAMHLREISRQLNLHL